MGYRKYQNPETALNICLQGETIAGEKTSSLVFQQRNLNCTSTSCLSIPVPGGVGLRVPEATSRLELPPDLLKQIY